MTCDRESRAEQPSDTDARRAGVRWYASGLRFECTGCGHCCTGGDGYVWMDLEEIHVLAHRLSLSIDDFGRRYLRRIGQRYALLERRPGGDCVFLRDNRCSVYEARPRQCANFPFWPAYLKSPEAWAAAARECEGIRDEAPLVHRVEIERLCPPPIVGSAHDVAAGGE